MKKLKVTSAILAAIICLLFITSCDLFARSLSTPENLAVNEQEKTLTWNAVENASGYIVSVDGEEYSALTDTKYSLAGLTEAKTYSLKVKALGKDGFGQYADSEWSAAAEYTVLEPKTDEPTEPEQPEPETLPAPENLQISDANLTWDEVPNASGYIVSIDDGETSMINDATYSLSYLTEYKTYQIKVKAVGNGTTYLDSDWSNAAEYELFEPQSEGLLFTLINNDTEYSVKAGTATDENIIIPTVYKGKSVTTIADEGFIDKAFIKTVSIPNSVISIGDSAFYGCTDLTNIEIPNSVTSIKNYAFYYCYGLTSITIGDNVTSIGGYAFAYCSRNLESITVLENNAYYKSVNNCLLTKGGEAILLGCKNSFIPIGVEVILEYAFADCYGLTSIAIPYSVIAIKDYAFFHCSNLTSIVIPPEVTYIGDFAFAVCDRLISIVIRNDIPRNTYIGNYAFARCSELRSIVISDNVTYIGDYAFADCDGLTSIVIPNSVTHIGSYAFYNTEIWNNTPNNSVVYADKWAVGYTDTLSGSLSLKTDTVGIGDSAFYDCYGLTSIEIPIGVTFVGSYAFYGCSDLTSIEIPTGVISIKSYTFYGCSVLTNIVIPNSVTSIESYAFYGCSDLTSIEIPTGVTSIESYAFYGCSGLTSIEIPTGVISIKSYTFYGCSDLTSIVISNSVTSIGDVAFSYCSGLTSVIIGNNVKSIGSNAFTYCSKLESITINRSASEGITALGNSVFVNYAVFTSIYVPADSVKAYKAASGWSRYATIITAIPA
jgi:hypothetical protein